MGTKNNPGEFDCYNRAEPDEPRFTLIGRDRLAGHLVSLWSKVRNGDPEAANAVFNDMMLKHSVGYCRNPDVEAASEAMECSIAMFRFREKKQKAL